MNRDDSKMTVALTACSNSADATPRAAPPIENSGFRRRLHSVFANETLNFWITNRIPRVLLTRFIGWYSRLQSERLTRFSVAVWRLFSDLDLSESPKRSYRSLQEVFTRPLLPGRRIVHPDPMFWVSPCDALPGASGVVQQGLVLQAKGAPYALSELFGNAQLALACDGWSYVTLRLTSTMYHRFHAPCDMRITQVDYISGDVFNVNPPALRRIPSLFCRNERAVLHCEDADGTRFLMVPVAAILVACIRLHCLPGSLSLALPGHCTYACDHAFSKGEELGWFEQGSTILLFVPPHLSILDAALASPPLRMGQALFEPVCSRDLSSH